MIVLSLVHRIVRPLVTWLDRRADAPIMRRDINARSNEYFVRAKAHAGETERDEVLDRTSMRKVE